MSNERIPVQEFQLASGKLFIAPTRAKDVVAIEGSVYGGPNMLPSTLDVIPEITAELLDAGTAKKSKHVIREGLAERGISLSFSASDDRTMFSGSCFPEDLPVLLATIVECLGEARFPESEVKNVKALTLGRLAEEKSDTRSQVERGLAALLYDTTHVNYARTVAEEEKSVAQTHRAALQKFRTMLGRGGLVLAIAGDIDTTTAHKAALRAFGKLNEGTVNAPVKHMNKKVQKAEERRIPIADKANIDVLLGVALPFTVEHELYHPMRVVIEMLGGGFVSHLMQTIRERDGLTYGVYAKLSGLAANADGYLKIWATFSPEKYAESVSQLRKEVNLFFAKGITEEKLSQKKDEIIGSYLVSLSTTGNLARTLHSLAISGFDLSYLHDYPRIIRGVTLADIRAAASLIPLDKLSLVASGTFPKN